MTKDLSGRCHCGRTGWSLQGDPGRITVCNCTLCRKYGALWAYDYENERIHLSGPQQTYRREGKADPALEICFCPHCAAVLAWRGLRPEAGQRYRMAVNIRLAEPDAVATLKIDRFDGLDRFDDLPDSGRCVADYWF